MLYSDLYCFYWTFISEIWLQKPQTWNNSFINFNYVYLLEKQRERIKNKTNSNESKCISGNLLNLHNFDYSRNFWNSEQTMLVFHDNERMEKCLENSKCNEKVFDGFLMEKFGFNLSKRMIYILLQLGNMYIKISHYQLIIIYYPKFIN